LTSLLAGEPTVAAYALTVAAVAAFLLHEPMLILLGQRGPRARREDGARAWRALWVLGGLTAAGAAAGIALGPATAAVSFAAPALLGALLVALISRKLEKTTGGELLAAAALSSFGLPVALAGGIPLESGVARWLVWVASLSAATVAVRAVIGKARAPDAPGISPRGFAWCLILLGAAAAALLALGTSVQAALLVLAPGGLAALTLSLLRIHPKHLRRVGWTLTGTSVATLVPLVTLF
jgi:hypothetical protein